MFEVRTYSNFKSNVKMSKTKITVFVVGFLFRRISHNDFSMNSICRKKKKLIQTYPCESDCNGKIVYGTMEIIFVLVHLR